MMNTVRWFLRCCVMSDAPRILVKPIFDVSPEETLDARARAWAYVFACFERHQSKKGGPDTAPDDAKEIKDEFRAKDIIPQ